MGTKYFTVKTKMPVPASNQHEGAFASGDVVVDWQAIQVPKGASCLRSVTIVNRPYGNATPTDNNSALDVIFSATNTVSLGTVHDDVSHYPNPDILGVIEIDSSNYGSQAYQGSMVASVGGDTSAALPPLVLQGDGDNVGFDTIYVAIVARDADLNFQSINAIAESGSAGAVSTQVITMDGTSMDVREHFAAGDVVHIGTSVGTPAADSLVGTIKSADSATQLTLESTSAIDLVDGDILYNLHPITLILGFER